MDALENLRRNYRDRESVARAKRESGVKVVGYFSNNIPVEFILAAGLFPVQLSGGAGETTEIGDRYMEDFCDGNIRSIFDRMLRGRFNFADLIVVPRTSESFLQLYYYLLEVRKWEPDRVFPEIHLFDLLQAPNWTVGRYDRSRLDELRLTLGRVTGRAISDEAVRGAVVRVNGNRRLLDRVNELRRQNPALLSGSNVLRIIGAAGFMDIDEHSACLRGILAAPEKLAPVAGRRLMIKGTPHEDDGFYALVESCGGAIVADDHVAGERIFEHCVDEDGDPMEALTEHYHLHSPSPRSYPQAAQDRRFMELVEQAQVEGVIFHHDEGDDVLGWDYPEQKKMLDAHGIPSLFLKKQSYRAPDRAAQRDAVTGFLRSLS